MTKRLYRQVMGVLLGEIATGALPPGHRLAPEPELAAHYGVSRGVMRECLRGLEERGMLEVRPGSGTRVLPETAWDVLDSDVLKALVDTGTAASALIELMECRRVIEVEAAGLAAERATGEDLIEISEALTRMVAATKAAEPNPAAETLFRDADVAFHAAVISAAGNRALSRLVRPIQPALVQARQPLARPGAARLERALPEHKAILNAIASRDPDGARAAMAQHLGTVEDYLKEYGRVRTTRQEALPGRPAVSSGPSQAPHEQGAV